MDVFISYRRDGADSLAQLLYTRLTNDGYDVFLDVETLRSGMFNKALLEQIENCNDFVLLLPPNGLDRCSDPNDWVRLEVEHAIRKNKPIIPVFLRNFEFPASLPESLSCLRFYNGIKADMDYFDAVLEKLENMLTSQKKTKQDKAYPVACSVLYNESTISLIEKLDGEIDNGETDKRDALKHVLSVYQLFRNRLGGFQNNGSNVHLFLTEAGILPDASVDENRFFREIEPFLIEASFLTENKGYLLDPDAQGIKPRCGQNVVEIRGVNYNVIDVFEDPNPENNARRIFVCCEPGDKALTRVSIFCLNGLSAFVPLSVEDGLPMLSFYAVFCRLFEYLPPAYSKKELETLHELVGYSGEYNDLMLTNRKLLTYPTLTGNVVSKRLFSTKKKFVSSGPDIHRLSTAYIPTAHGNEALLDIVEATTSKMEKENTKLYFILTCPIAKAYSELKGTTVTKYQYAPHVYAVKKLNANSSDSTLSFHECVGSLDLPNEIRVRFSLRMEWYSSFYKNLIFE